MLKIVIVSLFLLSGCSSEKTWIYKPNRYELPSVTEKFKNSTVVIKDFSDKREGDNKNYIMMRLVPLSPFGWQNLSAPENTNMHLCSGLWMNYNPKIDFAKSLSEEINSIELFKEAIYSGAIGQADYYINGEIISTQYKGKLFSYGLSVYGPVLWFIGLPATHISNDLSIKISLIDKNKNIVISKIYHAKKYDIYSWIYSINSDFNYANMLQEIYKQFIDDISKQ